MGRQRGVWGVPYTVHRPRGAGLRQLMAMSFDGMGYQIDQTSQDSYKN